MTITQLECFLEVAKIGSFSKAAGNLFLSQPTLTRNIQALEEELNVKLFVRANSATRLSPMGQALYPRLENMYKAFQKESGEIRELASRQSEVLRIGIQAGQRPTEELQTLLQNHDKIMPKTAMRLCFVSVKDSVSALLSGEIDLLFALEATVPETERLVKKELYRDRMCLAVNAGHPRANRNNVTNAEIPILFRDMEQHLIDVGEFYRDVQDDLTSRIDYDSDYLNKLTGRFAEVDSVMHMVVAGLGVSVMNEHCLLMDQESVRMIPLCDEEGNDYPIGLCMYGLKQMNSTAQRFWKNL